MNIPIHSLKILYQHSESILNWSTEKVNKMMRTVRYLMKNDDHVDFEGDAQWSRKCIIKRKYVTQNGAIRIYDNGGTTYHQISASATTKTKSHIFQDRNGIIAHLSDVVTSLPKWLFGVVFF
eukprot:gene2362-2830_t